MSTYKVDVTSSGTFTCDSASDSIITEYDTCIISCTVSDLEAYAEIQCNNSGTCRIECGAQKCLKGSTIYADSEVTHDLIITAEGKECMKATTTYFPNGGNTTISIVDTGDEKEMKEAAFIATQNTDHIWIDCSVSSPDDNCYELSINASTANYLEINGDSADMAYSDVYCPRDSPYDRGPSCIINANNAVMSGVSVYSKDGTPKDVLYGGVSGPWLYCDDGNMDITSTSGVCWNTADPTASPTSLAPTGNPSVNPTANPTSSSPTNTPSTNPTNIPSYGPSPDPTTNPTLNPSVDPSHSPSGNPSEFPTATPSQSTLSPSLIPTVSSQNGIFMMTSYPSTDSDGTLQLAMDSTSVSTVSPLSNESLSSNLSMTELDTITIICMVLSVLVCCLCAFWIFGMFKYNALRKQRTSEQEMSRHSTG